MTVNTKYVGKPKKESARNAYHATFSRDESIQVLDCGSSIQKKPGKACGKKASLIVSMLAKEKIGYKLEMKNLLYKKWRKWVLDASTFTTADVISASDVKEAIREFYRLVTIGELTWADGNLRMLELVQHIDGLLEVRVAPYVPGLFTLSEAKENKKEVKSDSSSIAPTINNAIKKTGVMACLKAMLDADISISERISIETAIKQLELLDSQKPMSSEEWLASKKLA